MQDYDNPAKNRVRSAWFAAIDRSFPEPTTEPLRALYLPGHQNLEGPGYHERGILTYPVERNAEVITLMEDPLLSAFPLDRKQVFHGDMHEFVGAHAEVGRPRFDIVYADFEGKIETCAPELVSVFRVFPGIRGGLLGLTTFANRDGQSVRNGVVFINILDAALGGVVKPKLEGLYRQFRPYLISHGDARAAAHTQLSRDFCILWRLILGMGMITQPLVTPGEINKDLRGRIGRVVGVAHREVAAIEALCNGHVMSFVDVQQARDLFEGFTTPLFPVTLQRFLYKTQNRNRMFTWVIHFGRLLSPIPLTEAVDGLWSLYSRSPLTFVQDDGNVKTYRPR